jgi:hypothetical protein
MAAVREKFLEITDRFAAFQAQCLNVHVDFPLLQKLALPIPLGKGKFPGIKIHDTRMIRLMEILLHSGTKLAGWRTQQIHQAVLKTYHLSPRAYGPNQLRYDLRKMRAHGLLERDGPHYGYPLANSLFHHRPNPQHAPQSKLETAYHKADAAVDEILQLLAA